MTRLLARWPLALLVLAPLAACASTESDPSKIPEPVKATDGGGSAPGAVADERSGADAAKATDVKLHSGRASEPGAEECQPVRTPEMITLVGGDMEARIEIRG